MNTHRAIDARSWIEGLLARGRYAFTRAEAESGLAGSPASTYQALRRLAQRGGLRMPHAGFYIIVDPQHRPAGTLPPEWFVDDLMSYLGLPYYVGLLSAAQLHGAAHHQPQEFQVIIPRRSIRPIHSGNATIRTFGKGSFARADTRQIKTPTGLMWASGPETTAWDLVRYPRAAGGLETVVTVLSELAPRLDSVRLRGAVRKHGNLCVAQRLGYILDQVARRGLTRELAEWVRQREPALRKLNPEAPATGSAVSRKWGLLLNAPVEAEG